MEAFEPPKYLEKLIAAINDGVNSAQVGALAFTATGRTDNAEDCPLPRLQLVHRGVRDRRSARGEGYSPRRSRQKRQLGGNHDCNRQDRGVATAVATFGLFAASATALDKKPVITLELAKKMIAGYEAKAQQAGWKMNIAIVDNRANLIAFERMDGAFLGSGYVAQHKAMSSVIPRAEERDPRTSDKTTTGPHPAAEGGLLL